MSEHFNKLSPVESELLALTSEELGESVQAIGKILRHGLQSVNPLVPDSPTNQEALERELGDVLAAIELLDHQCVVDMNKVNLAKRKKLLKVSRYLHHSLVPLHIGIGGVPAQNGDSHK